MLRKHGPHVKLDCLSSVEGCFRPFFKGQYINVDDVITFCFLSNENKIRRNLNEIRSFAILGGLLGLKGIFYCYSRPMNVLLFHWLTKN